MRAYVNRALNEPRPIAAPPTGRRPASRSTARVTNPVNGEQLPMYVADYVLMEYGTGAIMAVPGTRRARPRVRPHPRPADPPRHRAARRRACPTRRCPTPATAPWSTPVASTARPNRDRLRADDRVAAGRGPRARHGQLPAARLAAHPPALLGLPDPDPVLRVLRHGARPRRGSARSAARGRRLPAARPLAAGRRRAVGAHDLPALWRPRPARDRHDGHVRRLELVLPALLRRPQRPGALGPGGARAMGADRPVHRRHRARDPAPAVRPLLRQGARRHGPGVGAGAVFGAVHPGHDPRPRRAEDVELEGQRRRPERDRRALRRGCRPLLRAVHRAARSGRGLERDLVGGRAPVPRAAVAAGGGARPGTAPGPPNRPSTPRAARSRSCARPTGRSTR